MANPAVLSRAEALALLHPPRDDDPQTPMMAVMGGYPPAPRPLCVSLSPGSQEGGEEEGVEEEEEAVLLWVKLPCPWQDGGTSAVGVWCEECRCLANPLVLMCGDMA